MIVETFGVGPLACNCSIVVDPATSAAVVVDPGGDLDVIEARLSHHKAQVASIIHTHAHVDHMGATAQLHRRTSAPARIHEADKFLYDLLPMQAAMIGIACPERCELTADLADGTSVRAGGIELGVIHTPGHSRGGVSFWLKTPERTLLFTGDTLFCRAVGRTDLWGGDSATIIRSIHQRLFTFDDDAVVVPGHGPKTTIGEERRLNPFLVDH